MISDDQLKSLVEAELEWDPVLEASRVGVAVADGVVVLSGRMGSFAEKLAAVDAAKRVAGVRGLADEMTVRYAADKKTGDEEIARRICALFDWDMLVPDVGVQVTACNGWVDLTGQVDWRFQVDAAVRAARRICALDDTSPVLQPAEHDVDFVAGAVELVPVPDRAGATRATRDAGFGAAVAQRLAEPVGVIAPVGDEHRGGGHGRQHRRCTLIVADLPLGEQQHARATLLVADRVELGVQAALRASDTARNSPFLRSEVAVRCALRWVASTMSWSGLPPSADRPAKMGLNTPARLHRTNRL